jgi:hypothetical protein
MSRLVDGRAVLVAGSTGSGKTAWTMRQVERAPRLLVWDALGEWARAQRVQFAAMTLSCLGQEIKRASKHQSIAYCGPVSREHFAVFCKLAWLWLRMGQGTLVVEELADVTTPGKAPQAWGEICRKGRHVGAAVYAITQRPAESDKTIVGNAAAIHTGLMAFPRDRAYMAECLDVPAAEVAALQPLQWIERDMRTRKLTRGRVTF